MNPQNWGTAGPFSQSHGHLGRHPSLAVYDAVNGGAGHLEPGCQFGLIEPVTLNQYFLDIGPWARGFAVFRE